MLNGDGAGFEYRRIEGAVVTAAWVDIKTRDCKIKRLCR